MTTRCWHWGDNVSNSRRTRIGSRRLAVRVADFSLIVSWESGTTTFHVVATLCIVVSMGLTVRCLHRDSFGNALRWDSLGGLHPAGVTKSALVLHYDSGTSTFNITHVLCDSVHITLTRHARLIGRALIPGLNVSSVLPSLAVMEDVPVRTCPAQPTQYSPV